MLKEQIKNMVASLFNGDPVKAEAHFESAMNTKLASALEARKTVVAAKLFGTKVTEDYSKMSDEELDKAKPKSTGGAGSDDPHSHRDQMDWSREKDRRLAAAKKKKGKGK